MDLAARDVMTEEAVSVDPELSRPELERLFLLKKVSGFPVVSKGRLVGTISRSDIVRQFCAQQSIEEATSDFYQEIAPSALGESLDSLEEIAGRAGKRLENLRVKDVMIEQLRVVGLDAPVSNIARMMIDHHIHRVLVTRDDELLGIISSLDLVKLLVTNRD